jgi:hypothetical protein
MKLLSCFLFTVIFATQAYAEDISSQVAAHTKRGAVGRTIQVHMAVIEQNILNNRLGANIPHGQMYVLERDIVPSNYPFGGIQPPDPSKFKPGKVRLRSYKRPRPITLRANVGDTLEIHLRNLLPETIPVKNWTNTAGVQIMGLDWLNDPSGTNETLIKPVKPGKKVFVYRFYARAEGVFMMYSGDSSSTFVGNKLNYGLFGSVNVQPEEAEWYRSQVTQEDLKLATYRVKHSFFDTYLKAHDGAHCQTVFQSNQTGLPKGITLKLKKVKVVKEIEEFICPGIESNAVWEMTTPTLSDDETAKTAEVVITADRYLNTKTQQPVINYSAMYPQGNARFGSPVLDMLSLNTAGAYELAHSDLTAIITGPNAGRFPYYLDSPSFRENPATPDRRQPYREFSINYHISLETSQAFEVFKTGPLVNTLAAGVDDFAINYGIAGIGPEIYANRINKGPMGINKDGVDLLFEEFFLSSWSVGDPAILTDIPANNPNGTRATKALYPDDPSNVYHSYMRDHVKFRVVNAGSVGTHVHHQHAHQWLHTPNSDDGHYLDSQMIQPGSTHTMEMTYNGSGNRNQTVGDSIFHCHVYPHFAQGMWSLWRVHDVFEEGTELDKKGRPKEKSRALPDGEIERGTPIPALVPIPTIAMAPIPAKVKLVNLVTNKGTYKGRRAEVLPESDGKYKNPGFPFFVPGVAGHRAPHPPMDFAWKEDSQGYPMHYTKNEENHFHKVGERFLLDGGLPRHIILGGEVTREFHTRWDFTKDVGKLTAMELPENGTEIEKAAMKAHATRTHASYQPDGLPGNFILNGLPPVPGAPYAAPDVDDNGNSNFDARRYKAAVVQTDVVFNKEGWHYPQQRFITLLDDVKDTFDGNKPPEPFFFRSNTGETIEFWHTNLVPKYYELDDFQVRTPTDILGQHIHLVKFDVTSSDGAGNGFNYEDGTFSPDEVQDRIRTINKQGGLFHYNLNNPGSGLQSSLKLSHYTNDYSHLPSGHNWNGAQTTIQRFDTDPLLNHKGEDRTLRTVFTHDHFSPSTHQQIGLYGALLVEPAGSTWKNSITGCQMPSTSKGKCKPFRDDGGPTSWQAIIETNNSLESYREFAFATGDLQLAYGPNSISDKQVPNGIWFTIQNLDFPTALDYFRKMSRGKIPKGISKAFSEQGAVLANNAEVKPNFGLRFQLSPNGYDKFKLIFKRKRPSFSYDIEVRTETIDKGWADNSHAIWPPAAPSSPNGAAPYPQIISDPGGSGNIGTWVENYRNEPLDQRVQAGKGGDKKSTDPSFAYSSILRNKSRLNSQPHGGSTIGTSGFKYPKNSLVPEGPNGVQGTDPYTPLLRAYANDKVQVRSVVGAVDSFHSFQIQGSRWLTEPSYKNSGFRDVQGMGISEHFEMLFQLPPVGASKKPAHLKGSVVPFVDYLYAPSSATKGLAKGTWGIMRAYEDKVGKLVSLPNNPIGKGNVAKGFYDVPHGVTPRTFNISVDALTGFEGAVTGLQYSVCIKGKCAAHDKTLVLRANAGDWIELTLTNNITEAQAKQLKTNWGGNKSEYTSSNSVNPYSTSSRVGLHAALLSYDTTTSNGINIGFNGVNNDDYQTVAPGETKTYHWYAGQIELDENSKSKRKLIPTEFGAVNLLPSGSLLQQSYGLFGALIIEPIGAKWDDSEAYKLSADIYDSQGNPLFTEIVVTNINSSGSGIGGSATAVAGTEVRFRVLNPGAGSPGTTTDRGTTIAIEGHGWPEEPFKDDSKVIGRNPLTQWMGTQQVRALESYNLVLPRAGGAKAIPGSYDFYYYPKSINPTLGTLTVTPGFFKE